ncbi:MAG: hypothetical protein UX75_C0059G0008 [Candidatus Moranbacteria bacterium GW2011_GWE2_47_10]|nr:MAG: hypothetical protein UX75_C0059G0008 [Candidatus Moranbacteria bacterium GW2011_GWE2_47_10]
MEGKEAAFNLFLVILAIALIGYSLIWVDKGEQNVWVEAEQQGFATKIQSSSGEVWRWKTIEELQKVKGEAK